MDAERRLLAAAGGFGRGSRRAAAASGAGGAATALALAGGLLLAAAPPHRCRPDPALLPPALRNASGPRLLRAALPRLADGAWAPCLLFRRPPRPATGPCTRGWDYYGPPAAGLRATLVTQWDLVCEQRWLVPLEQVAFLAGWALGFLAFGAACDRFGRRAALLFPLMLSIPLGVAVALAVDYIMLVLLQLFFGVMLAGTFLSLYVTRLELCDPPHRLVVTLGAGLCCVLAELLLPGLAVACKEWRLLQGAVTLVLALLALCGWCPSLFPESARWLLATFQLEKSQRALRSLAEGNGVYLEEEFYAAEHLFPEQQSLSEELPPRPRYHHIGRIFCTRIIWKNSLLLAFTVFIGSGIRHCFTRNLAAYPPRFYLPYYLVAGEEAVALLFLCLTVDRFGRRPLLLLSTLLMGLSAVLLLGLLRYLGPRLILAFSILGILASHAVTALSILYAGEVLPTVLRGSGLGLILAAHMLGLAATPIMEIHNGRSFYLYHVVFGTFALLSVFCVMLLPETNGKPLPDSLAEGESLRQPPLFYYTGRYRDRRPLLGDDKPYDPASYARLVTSTKNMLGGPSSLDSQLRMKLFLEPPFRASPAEEM